MIINLEQVSPLASSSLPE